jgi:hypothetical protein
LAVVRISSSSAITDLSSTPNNGSKLTLQQPSKLVDIEYCQSVSVNMSSVQRSSSATAAGATATKKKFGKNLNKMVQATAPLAGGLASGNSKHHHSHHSNAGLLLLSTKKAGGGLLASKTTAAAAAAAAAASSACTTDGTSSIVTTSAPTDTSTAAAATTTTPSKPVAPKLSTHMAAKPVRSLAYESAPSTHDVLLSAVVGAVAESAHETPDAWGVTAAKGSEAAAAAAAAAAATATASAATTVDQMTVDMSTSTIHHHATALDAYGMERGMERGGGRERQHPHGHAYQQRKQQHQQHEDDHRDEDRFGPRFEIETSWDEYGGRGRGVNPTNGAGTGAGTSGAGTAGKQAKPVSDTPAEPAALPVAATTVTASTTAGISIDDDHDQVGYMSRLAQERAGKRRSEEDARFQEQKERAAERLRELEQKMLSSSTASPPDAPTATTAAAAWDRGDRGTTRTASGSGNRGLWEPDQQGHEKPKHTRDGDDYHRSSTSKNPDSHVNANSNINANSNYTGPVIQLSSYEDRDRGERKDSAAAPRMLYDPKSGSMVAVKAPRAGGSGNGNDDSRKERKASKLKKLENTANDRNTASSKQASKKLRGGKSDNRTNGTTTTPSTSKAESSVKKKVNVNPDRRLPRTTGVLYARDEKGNVYCADGCEGDLGYGAHSVRGGRARNATAYAEYNEKQQQQQPNQHQQQSRYKSNDEEHDNSYEQNLGNPYETDHQQPHESDDDLALYTGFNPEPEPEEPPEPIEWIKPTDKIELVTGLDDSPTLKPTAKEWSPSQTALAAASAARALAAKNQSSQDLAGDRSLDDVDEMTDEDDDDDPIGGLGFDPTQDMDFGMNSPAADPDRPSRLGVVHLDSLALEAPMFSSSNAASNPSHIFSFGTSGTWGASQAAPEGQSDWNVPGLSGGIFGSDAFRGVTETTTTDSTSSFLNNIPSSNSWGSPTGLGSLGGVSMNATDNTTNTNGD